MLRSFLGTVRRLYRRLTAPQEETSMREVTATLAEATAFQSLGKDALRELSEAVHKRTYRREEFLYYEDDPGLGLYVVQRGRVRLLAEDESGALHELRQVGPGEVFGDLSILGDFPRMESAQATAKTHALGFFRPDLKTMRQRHPKAAAAVVEALAQHLARRQVEIVHLVAESDGSIPARRMLEGAALRSTEAEAAAAPAASSALPDER